MGKIVGIDLGTTNSVVAVMEGGEPVVITNEEGSRLTPSVVAFTDTGERQVGQIAKRQAITNPKNTVFSIKRFMGRKFSEVKEEITMVPYKVVAGPNGDVRIDIRGKLQSPEEISALILQKLKKSAEAYLGQPVTEAVITVPAYFNDSQRTATKDAGKIAGFDVKRIINEPTAAALAYGLDKKKSETIAVYDFGGGTFDISILEVGDNVVEVKSTNGDTHLGGDNFDQKIIDWLVAEFRKDQAIDLSKDPMALQRLKEAAERAKIELSSTAETTINLPFITADASGPKHLNYRLTRAQFERLIEDLVNRALGPVKQAMKDAGVEPKQIDEVVLVGGSTRIPMIQQQVKDFFGKEPNKSVNPDEVVAVGAAVQAGVLAGEVRELLLLDVTPLSLGIETLGGVMTKIIDRNTTIPIRKSQIFSTAEDGQTSVEVHVLQGEREIASGNRTLGKFHLTGIPPAPRGMPQIEVTFDIDANGIVHVGAKDLATGKEQKIQIDRTSATGLSKEEVERSVREATVHAEEDRQRKELVETRNQLDTQIYAAEKLVKENREKISVGVLTPLEREIDASKTALKREDPAEMKGSLESLQSAVFKATEEMYAAAKPGAEAASGDGHGGDGGDEHGGGPGGQKRGPDVIDAEFEDNA